MSFEPNITLRPTPTKPAARGPNTRAMLRDLNRTRELQVFRRPSVVRRFLQFFIRKKS